VNQSIKPLTIIGEWISVGNLDLLDGVSIALVAVPRARYMRHGCALCATMLVMFDADLCITSSLQTVSTSD
jgi:hypothetical protein